MAMEPLGAADPTPPALPVSERKTGFASQPAEGADLALDVSDLLAPRPLSTFYFRVDDSPDPAIPSGSLVVVDRAIPVTDEVWVVYVEADGFGIRTYRGGQLWATNPALPPLTCTDEILFGVVTWVLTPAPGRIPRGHL